MPPENDKPLDALEASRLEKKRQAEADAKEAQDFLVFLSGLRRGAVVLRWAQKLAELNRAVRKHKRKGTMTITISIKPVGNTGQSVEWSDSVSIKPPKGEEPAVVLHHDREQDGRLTIDHPDSIAMISREQLEDGAQ